ncbi:MAG: hypothetical protein KC549_19475, partial [Myxococcales bacterium]|nr:hypothetical protein [Myxococcales bacterium]
GLRNSGGPLARRHGTRHHLGLPPVRRGAAGRLDDAALSLRRILELATNRAAIVAHARTLPALEKVLADPGLADLLR